MIMLQVQVRWFYHPAEVEGTAEGGGRVGDLQVTTNALFSSSHADQNDVQTISHRCSLLELEVSIVGHYSEILLTLCAGVQGEAGCGRHGGRLLPGRGVRASPRHHQVQTRGHPMRIAIQKICTSSLWPAESRDSCCIYLSDKCVL